MRLTDRYLKDLLRPHLVGVKKRVSQKRYREVIDFETTFVDAGAEAAGGEQALTIRTTEVYDLLIQLWDSVVAAQGVQNPVPPHLDDATEDKLRQGMVEVWPSAWTSNPYVLSAEWPVNIDSLQLVVLCRLWPRPCCSKTGSKSWWSRTHLRDGLLPSSPWPQYWTPSCQNSGSSWPVLSSRQKVVLVHPIALCCQVACGMWSVCLTIFSCAAMQVALAPVRLLLLPLQAAACSGSSRCQVPCLQLRPLLGVAAALLAAVATACRASSRREWQHQALPHLRLLKLLVPVLPPALAVHSSSSRHQAPPHKVWRHAHSAQVWVSVAL